MVILFILDTLHSATLRTRKIFFGIFFVYYTIKRAVVNSAFLFMGDDSFMNDMWSSPLPPGTGRPREIRWRQSQSEADQLITAKLFLET